MVNMVQNFTENKAGGQQSIVIISISVSEMLLLMGMVSATLATAIELIAGVAKVVYVIRVLVDKLGVKLLVRVSAFTSSVLRVHCVRMRNFEVALSSWALATRKVRVLGINRGG
ncbi:MAG: hypothetical protein JKX92_13095 [Porticoccaceae bacterium]|nr:hypothetical protein [Porticoccaceae bacterium]